MSKLVHFHSHLIVQKLLVGFKKEWEQKLIIFPPIGMSGGSAEGNDKSEGQRFSCKNKLTALVVACQRFSCKNKLTVLFPFEDFALDFRNVWAGLIIMEEYAKSYRRDSYVPMVWKQKL